MSENIRWYSDHPQNAEIAAQRIVIAAFESGALDISKLGVSLDDGQALGKFLGEVTNAVRDTLLKKA